VKSPEQWRPSKFVRRRGKLIASRDCREVSAGSRLMVDRVARFYDVQLPQHARGRLLDLGCGRVPLYAAYRDHVSRVVCVDWSLSPHQTNHLDRECDLNEPLPFAAGDFDTIILSDVLEHLAEPDRLWGEIARLLRTDGTLLMNVPFFYWLHERPHDYYRYTEFALRRFVQRHGLRLVHLEPLGGSPEVFVDLAAKHLQTVPLLGAPVARSAQAFVGWLTDTSPGRRLSRRTAATMPLGYALVAAKDS